MSIGIGIPVLVMILRTFFRCVLWFIYSHLTATEIVVQGHRFNIVEGVGCIPTIYNTPPAYPLVFMWPPLLGCVSFVYACAYVFCSL